MKRLNERINIVALCFAIVFSVILLVRFRSLENAEVIFYALAIFGFAWMCIAPLFSKRK